MRFRVSRPAQKDLEEIFAYWAERVSEAVADRVVDAIIDRFRLVGEFPDTGKPVDEIAAGVKCFPAGKYLIYYRRARQVTDILHIFHSARDQQLAFLSRRRRHP
jgi:toxin ParE1/3/4